MNFGQWFGFSACSYIERCAWNRRIVVIINVAILLPELYGAHLHPPCNRIIISGSFPRALYSYTNWVKKNEKHNRTTSYRSFTPTNFTLSVPNRYQFIGHVIFSSIFNFIEWNAWNFSYIIASVFVWSQQCVSFNAFRNSIWNDMKSMSERKRAARLTAKQTNNHNEWK